MSGEQQSELDSIGLDAAQLARVRQPLADAWTLPATAYTSKAVFELEMERVLRRSWMPVARLDQVPAPGDYLALDLLGQPVMVVHGHDGEIRVMSSVCLHRGAPVAQGHGSRNLFTCPYHAWSYDTTGQLKRAPLMEGCQDFKESDLRLPQIRSEQWCGFVLANLDHNALPFAPQVSAFADYFGNFEFEDLVIARTLEFDSQWNWKVLVENFMEAYHHIATHSTTFEPEFHARDSKVPDNSGPWSILHMPAADRQTEPNVMPGSKLEDWQARDLFAAVAYPCFLIGAQGSGAVWYQVFPAAADRTILKIHILLPGLLLRTPDGEQIAEGLAAGVAHIHEEDIAANDLVWRGLNAPLTSQGRLSPLEKSIWQGNQWWLDQIS